MTDEERIEWLMGDPERLRYVQEYMRMAEQDFDLRDAIDRLSEYSAEDIRATFTVHQDRRMKNR